MRRVIAGVALAALLPLVASAATVEELRVQIEALLAQVTALQQRLGGGAVTQGTGGTSAASIQCPYISRDLKPGMSGDDVARLQRFLALDPAIYPEAKVTGYYGPLTEAAVRRFQCKFKIVCSGSPATNGYGVTGPRTGAILALQCPDISANVGGFIKVTPTSGTAPLPVSIEATVNTTKSCTSASYEIMYGDNTPSSIITVPANSCNELRQTFNHTYLANGTYTITLRSGVHQTSAVVVVGTGVTQPVSDTFSATPLSGAVPLSVTLSGRINGAGACGAGPYTIQFGDGQTSSIPVAGCAVSNYTAVHVYGTAGTYSARLYRGTPAAEIGAATIQAGSGAVSGAGAFSVTAGIGGNPLAAQANFDLSTSCTRYDLDWGDGTTHAAQAQGSCSAGTVSKQVSHTYQSSASGQYTVFLYRGASLESTDTVAITIVN